MIDAELIEKGQILLDAQAAADQFSGAVLIAHGNQPILTTAHGFAIHPNVLPNQPDTKFNIVSVTKMLTAVAVMQLELMGNTGYVVLGTVIEQVTGESVLRLHAPFDLISRWACRIPTTMKWTFHRELCDRLYRENWFGRPMVLPIC